MARRESTRRRRRGIVHANILQCAILAAPALSPSLIASFSARSVRTSFFYHYEAILSVYVLTGLALPYSNYHNQVSIPASRLFALDGGGLASSVRRFVRSAGSADKMRWRS